MLFKCKDYKMVLVIIAISVSFIGCAAVTEIRDGDILAAQGRWDEALDSYSGALEKSPGNNEYRIKVQRARLEAGMVHMKKGRELLEKKDYDRAMLEAQVAFVLNPSLRRAKFLSVEAKKRKDAEYYYTTGLEFLKAEKEDGAKAAFKKAVSLDPSLLEAKEELQKIMAAKKTMIGGYELDLKSEKPLTLKFKNTPVKDIFDIISKLSGINFIFDEGVKKKKASIFMEDATFEQAMDLLLMTNKLFKKVVNENTIILVPDTKQKRQQYQDLLIHTFYLSNLEAKKAVNLLRTLLHIKSIYINDKLNTIVVRDTPETIELAEKILKANDLADAEVMLEVEILEISNSRIENIGLDLDPDRIDIGLREGGAEGALTYNTLKKFSRGDMLFSIPDIIINLQKQAGNVNTLANPRIRVANNKKAKVHIGDRVPIITSTVNNGVTTENVQYVDVGVKLNVEPKIHLDNDVSLKITLEISTLGPETRTDNSRVFQIGTRNASTELRLHDGETQIIGGLISEDERTTTVKIPILGDIPIIGRLFSSTSDEGAKKEVLLSITPHIIRVKEIADPEVSSIWSGRAQEFSSKAPFESFIGEEAEIDLPAAPGRRPNRGIRPPSATGIPTSSGPEDGVPIPGGFPLDSNAGELVEDEGNVVSLSIDGPASVPLGQEFALHVRLNNAFKVVSTPFYLRYEPKYLKFVNASDGGFMKQDGKSTSFMTSNDEKSGRIIVGNSRLGDREGINGSGSLMTVSFRASGKGSARVYIENAKVTGVDGKTITAQLSDKIVEII